MKFNHALRRALAALVLIAAAGCNPGAQAPSSDRAPTSIAQAPDAPPAPAAAPAPPIDGLSEEGASAREIEAKWLKEFPGAARREGGVLTLFTGGTAVARVTDTDSSWVFTGALKTLGPSGERLFFEVTEIYTDEDGRTEWIEHWFDPAGQFIPSNRVLGQNPGRTMIAAGHYEGGDVGIEPHLSLMDWSVDPELVYEFKSPCYPVKWISDEELEAACPYDYVGNTPEDDEIIPARVVRTGPREWRLQQEGLPTRNMPSPPQTAPFDETVAAAEITPDPDYEAHLSELGYLQLDR
jgi:hypothetical protein